MPKTKYAPARGAGHGGPARGLGWGGPAGGEGTDGPKPSTAHASAVLAAMTPEELEARRIARMAKADALLERVYETGMTEPMQAVAAAMAYHKIAGLMPAEKQELAGPNGSALFPAVKVVFGDPSDHDGEVPAEPEAAV